MDIFQALASTTDSGDFVMVTGYSMHDYATFGKYIAIQWIGAPLVFIEHNQWKVIGFGAFIFILAIIIRFFNVGFASRPARR